MSDEITNLMLREGLTFPQAVEKLAAGALKRRERLPDRRRQLSLEIDHNGLRFTLSVGRYEDGRLGEAFISGRKTGEDIEGLARDAAILLSLVLQYGADPAVIARALTRSDDGNPATLIGAAADALAREGGPTR